MRGEEPQTEQRRHLNLSEAYKNFINSLDSGATRRCYHRSLEYFMTFLKAENYESLLKIDITKLEALIRDYMVHMRYDKNLSPATVSLRIAALVHFFEMNDISLRWKKLKKFKGKFRNIVEDKPYTREQIKRLIDAAGTLRDKAMIMLMAASGMRRGALPHLRLKDLTRIDKYGLLKFNVYKKEQESYITYCTPEATILIDQYLKWRERLGEQLTPNSPLFRANFDPLVQTKRPQIIGSEAVGKMINRLLEVTEIKAPSTYNYKKRNETMETHGLRKFFKTTCINAGMHPLYSEYLMGHKSGLTKSYFKPTDTELLEGNDKALGYTAVINDLTINEEFRLRKKVDELIKKKDEIELMEIKHREDLKTMREEMENRFSQLLMKIDVGKLS